MMEGVSTAIGAHPRSRGEHADVTTAISGPLGSSPLTRGAPKVPSAPHHRSRLIPAHAGSTKPCLISFNSPLGSSPLTRGAPSLNSGGGAVHIGRGTT